MITQSEAEAQKGLGPTLDLGTCKYWGYSQDRWCYAEPRRGCREAARPVTDQRRRPHVPEREALTAVMDLAISSASLSNLVGALIFLGLTSMWNLARCLFSSSKSLSSFAGRSIACPMTTRVFITA